MSSPLPIGIDFGTLNSCVGIWDKNRVEILSSSEDKKLIPSCVSFTSTERLVGDTAKKHILGIKPPYLNTIFGIKNLIGRKFDDPKVVYESREQNLNILNIHGNPRIQVDWRGETKYFAPEEISAMVLSHLKLISKTYTGTIFKDTVISAPASFNSSQRRGLKDAVTIAGLNMCRIISKPVAAALTYNFFDTSGQGPKNILIFDLGCVATEVTVVSVSKKSLEIKAVAIDQGFGGRDFDDRLIKHLKNEFKRKFKFDLKSYLPDELVSTTKHNLSTTTEVEIKIKNSDAIDLSTKLSRNKFEEICSDLFCRIRSLVKKALQDAKLTASSVDDIVLVGGSTRIPKIQNILLDYFPNKIIKFPVDPEIVVAFGATIYAAVLNRDKTIGSHIQTQSLSVVDVIPFSLCIGIDGGEITKIIKRNTKFPCTHTHSFDLVTKCCSSIMINVFEGERAVCAKNNLLCALQITDIPTVPSEFKEIKVFFIIDENRILDVTAEDTSYYSSTPLKVVFHGNVGLSKGELDKMVLEETERCKEEDHMWMQKNTEKGAKRKLSE